MSFASWQAGVARRKATHLSLHDATGSFSPPLLFLAVGGPRAHVHPTIAWSEHFATVA